MKASSFGWAGSILRVDLSHGTSTVIDSSGYTSRFIGGKGVASRLYWEQVGKKTGAFSPDNHLFIMNGPLGGIRATAASRWVIVSKSPLLYPEQYACGNLGGYFGAALKWAGLDGLDILGAAAMPVMLLIEPGVRCTILDASGLWGQDTSSTISSVQATYGRDAPVITIGPAGEQKVRFANVIGSGGISATKGFGAVLGSKNLKAIVVRAPKKILPVAEPDDFKAIIREINSLTLGEKSGRYHGEVKLDGVDKVADAYCYGCSGICRRGLFRSGAGEEGYRINCASSFFYRSWEKARLGTGGEVTFHATETANRYGICVLEMTMLCKWLPRAMESGAVVGLPPQLDIRELGTAEWLDALAGLIVSRRGVGDLLAEGSRRAAAALGLENMLSGIVTRTGTLPAAGHDPRLFPLLIPIYATEPNYVTSQIHEVSRPLRQWMLWHHSGGKRGFLSTDKLYRLAELFWGGRRAAEFDLPEGTGKAAAHIQNRAYAKENMVACDWFWPISFSGDRESGVGDPELEARLFTAVTGMLMNEATYLRSGAGICNLNRAIYLREGRRGRTDDVLEDRLYDEPFVRSSSQIARVNPDYLMPGRNGTVSSRKGDVVARDEFQQIMDEYYRARDWDVATGLFTPHGLEELGLADMLPSLTRLGFVA